MQRVLHFAGWYQGPHSFALECKSVVAKEPALGRWALAKFHRDFLEAVHGIFGASCALLPLSIHPSQTLQKRPRSVLGLEILGDWIVRVFSSAFVMRPWAELQRPWSTAS